MDKINKKKFFVSLSLLVFFIFILNTLAGKFYWYYSIWYFDMIMHFLGGLWLGLVFIWIFLIKKSLKTDQFFGLLDIRLIIQIILCVLIIGVSWEIFEIVFNNIIAGDTFNLLDTVSDVFCDLAGGTFAVLYFYSKRTMFQKEDKV
jgi:CDP-diglyceride synthetase